MANLKYQIKQVGEFFIGFWEEYPDYQTQGHTKAETLENLIDLRADLSSGKVPFVNRLTDEQLNNLFRYHEPKPEQIIRYNQIRAAARSFAALVNEGVDSAEKTLAIRKIQEAVMWANAGIACNEK